MSATESHRTLIDAPALRRLMAQRPEALVLLDCRFDLGDPAAGEAAYRRGHLPGARYAHLDRDLSAARDGRNGRHPLPAREAFAGRVGRWGVLPGIQVVAYDGQGGPYAARAWWMLRWLGHGSVAVLDGGLGAWTAASGPLDDAPAPDVDGPAYPVAATAAMPDIAVGQLAAELGQWRVLDARNGERFRGESEPLDPVAGRIPGATLRFFKDNLQSDGRFKPAAALRAEFDALATAPSRCVHQCGSGVTACHNLLAMEHAGLPGSLLYAGSWSEWCADPGRPVARG